MAQILFCYDTLIVTHSLLGTEPYYSPPPSYQQMEGVVQHLWAIIHYLYHSP